jgi:hypothetical protein
LGTLVKRMSVKKWEVCGNRSTGLTMLYNKKDISGYWE